MNKNLLNSDYNLKNLEFNSNSFRNILINKISKEGGNLSGLLSFVDIFVCLNKYLDDNTLLFYTNKSINILNDLNNSDYKNNSLYTIINLINDNPDKDIIIIIDDNDLTNIEVFKLISDLNRHIILIYNDVTSNDSSHLSDQFISLMRNTKSYNNLKNNIKKLIKPLKGGQVIIKNIHNIKDRIKKNIIDEGIFKQLNFNYIGPINGHNHKQIIQSLNNAFEKDYSSVIHFKTILGKGYSYAENSPNNYLDILPFNIDSGRVIVEESDDYKYGYNIVFNTIENLIKDYNIICLSDRYAISKYAGLAAKYPDHVIRLDSMIDNVVKYGIGLTNNSIPFIYLKSSQLIDIYPTLINDLDTLNKAFIIHVFKENDNDLNILNNLKNINIFEANNCLNIQNIIYSALNYHNPSIIIYNNTCLRYTPNTNYEEINLGKWEKYKHNDMEDIVILSNGKYFDLIKEIVDKNNYNYEVVNTGFINPLDFEYLQKILNNNTRIYLYKSNIYHKFIDYINSGNYKAKIRYIDNNDINVLFEEIEGE